MSTKKTYEVFNRTSGIVAYSIPDLNVERTFVPGERKLLTHEELEKLSYTDGGAYLLKNCLLIKDMEIIDELNISKEPEYFYTEEEVKQLLTTGTIDQLSDTLTFAPAGVLDLVKTLAVKLPITDTVKMEMISKKFGVDIMKMIENSKAEEEAVKTAAAKVRKAAPVTNPTAPVAPAIPTTRKAEPITNKEQ